MGTRFFGQFLVDEGVIDAFQLRQATDHMTWVNRTLGELAVKRKMLSAGEVERVLEAQRCSDARFGEVAIEMGLLQPDQVEDLIADQRSRQSRVGEALVELGHLTKPRLEELLQRFLDDQAAVLSGPEAFPTEVAQSAIAARIVDLFPRIVLRTTVLPVKIGPGGPWGGAEPMAVAASMTVRGTETIEAGLCVEERFARDLVAHRCRRDPASVSDEESIGVVSDVLGTTASAAAMALEGGRRLSLSAISRGTMPARGAAFEVVSTSGRGWLVLAVHP